MYEQSIDPVVGTKRAEAIGQFDLFSFGADEPAADTSDVFAVRVPDGAGQIRLLNFEREMLGLYVSDHPLLGVEHILKAAAGEHRRPATDVVKDGERVVVAGILSSVTRRMEKDGTPWARWCWRTSRVRWRCCSSRSPTPRLACRSSRTPSW